MNPAPPDAVARRKSPGCPARAAALACLGLLAASTADARVFLRWSAAARSTRALEESGGRAAYTSNVSVNGGRGTLTVFLFDRPLTETVAALSGAFSQKLRFDGGSMASGTIRQGGTTLHLFLIEPERNGETVVFKLEQADSEAEAARSREGIEPLKGLPEYPAARVLFTASDETGSFRMAVSGAAGESDAVQAYYAQEFTSAGWAAVLPPKAAGAMQMYRRGADLCIVQSRPGAAPGEVRITVLHKKQRTVSNSP